MLTHIGGPASSGVFNSVAIQPDNKILAAGSAVCRYNPDGSLDNSFAVHGMFTGSSGASAMAVQADGKIVTVYGKIITRLNADGTLDNTFGVGGIDTIHFDSVQMGGVAVALQPDGKIVIGGGATTISMSSAIRSLARFAPNGLPDTSFGVNGLVLTPSPAGVVSGIAIMPDGRIVVCGEATYQHAFVLIRYMPDGSFDTSFNHTGIVTTNAGYDYNAACASLLLQPDGKIVAAGSARFVPTALDFIAIRYNLDGSLDRSFGDTGVANVNFGGDVEAEATAICQTPNKKIVIAGYVPLNGGNFGLSRLDTNGIIDSFFGYNGKITTLIGSGYDIPYGTAIQPDGKIVAAGWSYNSIVHDPTIARYIAVPLTNVPEPTSVTNDIVLYPNPANDKIFIKDSYFGSITKVSVYDINGKEITAPYEACDKEIRTNSLTDGLYILRIYFDDNPPIFKKIVIQNSR